MKTEVVGIKIKGKKFKIAQVEFTGNWRTYKLGPHSAFMDNKILMGECIELKCEMKDAVIVEVEVKVTSYRFLRIFPISRVTTHWITELDLIEKEIIPEPEYKYNRC